MRRRALVLALALLVVSAGPASALDGLSRPEGYLAYRVRITRHESYSKLTQFMVTLAGKRAHEIAVSFRHRSLWELSSRGCWWGEILARTWVNDPTDPYRRATTRWAIGAWLASPSHRAVLLGRWSRYGTGMYYTRGQWYMVVDFARC